MGDSQRYMRDSNRMDNTIGICAVMLNVFARRLPKVTSLKTGIDMPN